MSARKPRIYIDGQEGTTGLQICDRLGVREDIELIRIEDDRRKDVKRRRELMNESDIVFLCLPDKAAIEAAALVENPDTRIIDASTAHRTDDNWVYGFPELSARQRKDIAASKRVANPGCHASGFIAPIAPLVKTGIIPADMELCCYSITGYSGGGKKMIAEYEAKTRDTSPDAPRHYSLGLRHKHVPEMVKHCGLCKTPVFAPIVAPYYSGISTGIMLPGFDASSVHKALSDYYKDEYFVRVRPFQAESVSANALSGTNYLDIYVCGHDTQTIIVSVFDNLGKGASGAAVQNMNIMLGLDEKTGL
ncbi:MAG: N-acetyl-gamma-glutamyl-phosphate reductase [Oscillospiraceae bacterium]|jgi:N-acetyl-gamma-glutamyl-phosphate reductase